MENQQDPKLTKLLNDQRFMQADPEAKKKTLGRFLAMNYPDLEGAEFDTKLESLTLTYATPDGSKKKLPKLLQFLRQLIPGSKRHVSSGA